MALGKETFALTKKDYSEKIGKIIANHRVGTRLIGEPKEFILRSCRLCEQWAKLAGDVNVLVYLRNVEIAGGRAVKMLSLERGNTKQPVSKSKLVDCLYPVKKIATTATPEEKHYNAVKAAMRRGINEQLSEFRTSLELPVVCYLSGKYIRKGTRTDVDHVGLSFSEIADCFISGIGFKYTDIVLYGPPTAKRFKDLELWEAWKDFHRLKARYALVFASANRAKGAEGYLTPKELYGSFKGSSEEDLSLEF